MTKDELVKAVKQHAVDNYETGGWDYLVECYSDSEVAELIGGCRTVEGAVKKVGKVMGIKADYREDIQGTVW